MALPAVTTPLSNPSYDPRIGHKRPISRTWVTRSTLRGPGATFGSISGLLRAGATVIRGIEGFGANAHLHTTRILRLSEDLPILIEVVDQEDRIRAILPELDEMVGDGLITLEKVEVLAYRAGPPG